MWECELEIGGKRYALKCDYYVYDHVQVVEEAVYKHLKKKVFRSTPDQILESYYGEARHWPLPNKFIPREYQKKSKASFCNQPNYMYLRYFIKIPCVYEYQYGSRGLFYWRDVLRILPKRPRCKICGAPPTRWRETAHGKRKGGTGDEYNCIGGDSYVLTERRRKWREEYEHKKEIKNGIYRARLEAEKKILERKEERKWLKEAQMQLRKVRKYLRQPSSPDLSA